MEGEGEEADQPRVDGVAAVVEQEAERAAGARPPRVLAVHVVQRLLRVALLLELHEAEAAVRATQERLAREEAEEKARKAKERKVDWKDLAGKIGQMHNGSMPDMRAMMRLQRILLDLSTEELNAQLDEIAALINKPDKGGLTAEDVEFLRAKAQSLGKLIAAGTEKK